MTAAVRNLLARIDLDAAFWFAVALVASAFGMLPVLAAGLALLHHPLDGAAYVLVTGGVTGLAFGVVAALLVRARPWRRFGDLVLTLYVLNLAGGLLLALGQLIRTPGLPALIVGPLLAPLSFGAIQIVTLSPLRLDVPDMWPLIGFVAGFWLMRWRFAAHGWPTGDAARVELRPWPLAASGRPADRG